MLEIRTLGAFSIKFGRKSIALRSRPAQSLFAYLVLNAGTSHRREKLAGQLWPESREEAARSYLRQALWRIRRALEPAGAAELLQSDDLTASFAAPGDYVLDAALLKQTIKAQSAAELMAALSAYGGELLPGFYEEWVVLERQHLQAIYEQEMSRLLGLLEQEGAWPAVLEWSEKWIAFGQKPEAAYRGLMLAHAARGDMSKVAATYERCAKALSEMGFEPSEVTRVLYEEIKAGRHTPAAPSRSPTHRPDAPALSNIPVPLTSFVGREQELKQVSQLLTSSRLVTLTGPGGVGKTRLAIRAAADSIESFRDGVGWVSLGGLADPDLIPHEIARVLALQEVAEEPMLQTVLKFLRGRQSLLILDNCEHLVAGCARIVEQLLATCPDLRILATSTEALGLFNEAAYQVPSLALPGSEPGESFSELRRNESVRLFEERASIAGPRFHLEENEAQDVIQICRRLDGMPLAIELAAARTRLLSIHEIAQHLDDRFSLLTAGSRTAIPRHQTLRATIDWSHDLLSQPERILFRRLSIFAGGFCLDGVESICSSGLQAGEALDLLGRLVGRSLVVVEDAEGDRTWYRLLESIRQYALEKLQAAAEEDEVRGRHLDYYVQLAEEAEPNIYAQDDASWFRRLRHEVDNIREAAEWATASGHADLALRILSSIVELAYIHGIAGSEWTARTERALGRPEGQRRSLTRAKALTSLGFMYWVDLDLADRRPGLEEALSIGQELGDRPTMAAALATLGLMDAMQGKLKEARQHLESSLQLQNEPGPQARVGSSDTLLFLGDVLILQGESSQARAAFEDSLAASIPAGDSQRRAYAARRLAQLAWRDGDFARASSLCRESLELNRDVAGDARAVCACLAGFAAIRLGQGDAEAAALLAAAMEAELQRLGIRLLYMDRLEYEHTATEIRTHLAAQKLERLWAKGAALPLDKAIDLALHAAPSPHTRAPRKPAQHTLKRRRGIRSRTRSG